MKIIVVGTRGIPDILGGVEKHCEKIYPKLAKLGCDITIIVRKNYVPEHSRISAWNNVKISYLWTVKYKHFEAIVHTFAGCIFSIFKRPDIVHFHNMGPALCLPLVKIFGIKTVFTYHSINYLHQKWGCIAKLILKLSEWIGVTFADHIIVVSKATTKMLQERYPTKKIVYIPNGIEFKLNKEIGILSRYALKPKSYVFTAGRITPEKGIVDLEKAYLSIENPPFKLVIAGDADYKNEYTEVVNKYAKKSSNIILVGLMGRDALTELFRNASLFVLPSYSEGLPMVLLEALGSNLPVIVSDIPQTRDFRLADYRYYTPGNVKELATKLKELYGKGLTEGEKEYYKHLPGEYDWSIIAEQTHQIYRKCCQ
jgi:glycosyltransferase involved in cell wall biosynthesis